ncbi:MAG: dihydrolipoyl dehydrogenase, partial [Syntrophaceae bacterium]|nr:dihydrolipoyl dehydrogenase [Syntrophaceae bacterium]
AAICASQRGLKTLLIEKDSLGGTCLNRGCIPTKSLVYDSKFFRAARSSNILKGSDKLVLDPLAMLERKRRIVKTLAGGVKSLLKSNGVEVIRGAGKLTAPGRITIEQTDGSSVIHSARNIIVATGSEPMVPPFIELSNHLVQTTDEALDDENIPGKIAVIGGGVIGVEMASIYLNLGCEVTIIELLPHILMTEDSEIRKAVHEGLKKSGATIHLKAAVQDVSVCEGAVDVIFHDHKGEVQKLRVDRVIVATGRRPVFSGIDCDKIGLEKEGPFIKVNARLETNLPGVHAIGDVVGGMMLAHKASAEAEAAVGNIAGGNKTVKADYIPRCIWGLSEIGAVGLTEEEAVKTGRGVRIGKFPFMANGAARAMGNTDGFVKIVGDSDTGEILGVHIVGEHATDLIGEAVTVMNMEGVVEDLYKAIKPHPTLSETIREAALDWNDLAIHSPQKAL